MTANQRQCAVCTISPGVDVATSGVLLGGHAASVGRSDRADITEDAKAVCVTVKSCKQTMHVSPTKTQVTDLAEEADSKQLNTLNGTHCQVYCKYQSYCDSAEIKIASLTAEWYICSCWKVPRNCHPPPAVTQ